MKKIESMLKRNFDNGNGNLLGNLLNNLGVAAIYLIGLTVVILQLRSLL